jgi:transcription elongation factor GreA
MPSRQKHHTDDQDSSLGQAATRFLLTVSAESAPKVQQEVFKFIRWYGEDRKVSSLTGQEIANYADQLNTTSSRSSDHLTNVKLFLTYVHKQGLIAVNLAAHIRIKKVSSKTAGSAKSRMEEPIVLTSQGYEDLKRKLSDLRDERPRIVEELTRAAADKDFRENAPLEAAREKQGHIEGQIRELEETIKRAKVAETVNEGTLRVTLGDKVTISDIDTGEKIEYTLVGSKEANIRVGKISMASPMGQPMFNKEVGEIFEVNAPSGVLKYKIVEIIRV